MSNIIISPFENASGSKSFRVSGTVNGKHRRQNFKSEAEALTVKQNWEREIHNLAPLPAITTRLTTDQAKEAEHCFRLIDGKGQTLTALVTFALDNYRPAEVDITVAKAIEQFVAEKTASNKRPISIRNLKQRLVYLKLTCGNANVNTVMPDVVRVLIERNDTSPRTRLNYRLALSNFFNWCVRKKYCAVSPVDSLEAITVDVAEPTVLTVAECRRLLCHALAYKDGALVPYVALALFCGIRPTEVTRLSWDNLDLENQTVTIGAAIAKMRGRRIVGISDNAMEFLRDHATKKTSFAPSRRHWDELRRLAGWTDLSTWTPDVLRHTGISMHLAKHQHEGLTATWAGNSPDMVQKHYKGLVKAKDAIEFWDIVPDMLGADIVQLKAGAK